MKVDVKVTVKVTIKNDVMVDIRVQVTIVVRGLGIYMRGRPCIERFLQVKVGVRVSGRDILSLR